ncbi:MAG: hypothetical protein RIQ65_360, partial [Pseudomonadota bacterium]
EVNNKAAIKADIFFNMMILLNLLIMLLNYKISKKANS